MHTMDDPLLSPVVQAARDELQNPRILSDRIAVGRALWRELVIGFAHQLGSLDIGFTQLAALYAVAGPETLTVGDLADQLDRSPSATSRLVSELVEQGYLERIEEVADRRQRVLVADGRGRRRCSRPSIASPGRPVPGGGATHAHGRACAGGHGCRRAGQPRRDRAWRPAPRAAATR